MTKGRRIVLSVLCVIILSVASIGCFGNVGRKPRYTITLYHQPAGQDAPIAATKSIGMLDEVGFVIADDPLWETNGWSAWVLVTDENGNRVYAPEVAWTTDIPECIRVLPVPERTDAVGIRPFPGSDVGRGHVYATYRGAMASLEMVSYGQFELTFQTGETTSDGWLFGSRQIMDPSEADFYITCDPSDTARRAFHAPRGILLREQQEKTSWAVFEAYQEPSIDGFAESVDQEYGRIYEVIDQDGVHYRLAATGMYSSSDEQRITMTWAPFW